MLLALTTLPFYQQFIEIVSTASLWEQSLPHSRLHSEHIPVALSEKSNAVSPTRMLQWSCRGERRGTQGSLSVSSDKQTRIMPDNSKTWTLVAYIT